MSTSTIQDHRDLCRRNIISEIWKTREDPKKHRMAHSSNVGSWVAHLLRRPRPPPWLWENMGKPLPSLATLGSAPDWLWHKCWSKVHLMLKAPKSCMKARTATSTPDWHTEDVLGKTTISRSGRDIFDLKPSIKRKSSQRDPGVPGSNRPTKRSRAGPTTKHDQGLSHLSCKTM